MSAKEMLIIIELVGQLLAKRAVQRCASRKDQFMPGIFTVPKPDGSCRLIINLKSLNKFIQPQRFQIEDGRTVFKLLPKDGFMTTLDIKDEDYLILIYKSQNSLDLYLRNFGYLSSNIFRRYTYFCQIIRRLCQKSESCQ